MKFDDYIKKDLLDENLSGYNNVLRQFRSMVSNIKSENADVDLWLKLGIDLNIISHKDADKIERMIL